MYSTQNKGKSVVSEKFIRTLKNKIYKYMTSISKNVYIDTLDDMVNEYNNTYHRIIKMKPVDVKSGNFIEYNVHSIDKDPKFKIGDYVRISKYKNIFAKDYTTNWSEEVFVIKKFKNAVPLNQEAFRIEKVIKKKVNKLYVKWRGYYNSFNSWIDKRDIVK